MTTRFETFSFLPPLSPGQSMSQIENMLKNNFMPMIEFADDPSSDDSYWRLWPLTNLHKQDAKGKTKEIEAAHVVTQVDACARRHPYSYVRLSGYDRETQTYGLSFIMRTPAEAA